MHLLKSDLGVLRKDSILEKVPLISIGYDMEEMAEEFCGGGLLEEHSESFASSDGRGEGDGAAPGCG
jgi:hypothetical protein